MLPISQTHIGHSLKSAQPLGKYIAGFRKNKKSLTKVYEFEDFNNKVGKVVEDCKFANVAAKDRALSNAVFCGLNSNVPGRKKSNKEMMSPWTTL